MSEEGNAGVYAVGRFDGLQAYSPANPVMRPGSKPLCSCCKPAVQRDSTSCAER